MKNKILHILASMFLLAALVGCDEKLDCYDTETCWLRFDLDKMSDTLQTHTFVYAGAEAETDTVWINVKTVGNVKDYDRKITLVQLESDTTDAVPGKHYVAFNDASLASWYVMPAHQVKTRVPVVFKRDASLKTEDVLLKLEIGVSEDFQPGFTKPFTIHLWIGDRIARPKHWSYSTDYEIGPYDRGLHQCLIDITGEKWDDEYLYEVLGYDGVSGEWYEDEDTGEEMWWPYGTNDNYEYAYIQVLVKRWQKLLEEDNARRVAAGLDVWMREDGEPVTIGDIGDDDYSDDDGDDYDYDE